jgi:hypothetical protein
LRAAQRLQVVSYGKLNCFEALEGFGDFQIRGQVIRTVKYAYDVMLLAKEETVLQGMIDRLIEIGRCYRLDMNAEKTKGVRISR